MKKQNFVSESEKGGAPRLWGAPPFFGSRGKRRLTALARSAQSVHRGEAAAAHPAFFAGAVRAQPFPALRAAVRRRRVQGLPASPAKISVHGNPSRKQVCSLFPRIMLRICGRVRHACPLLHKRLSHACRKGNGRNLTMAFFGKSGTEQTIPQSCLRMTAPFAQGSHGLGACVDSFCAREPKKRDSCCGFCTREP